MRFVNAVFPNAKFIHLVRNGEDVIKSATRQWLAAPDLYYVLKKTTTFPLIDAFDYGVAYALDTLRRLLPSKHKIPSIWGPRYDGIEQDIESKSLIQVCAIQWFKCLEMATKDLLGIEKDRVFLDPL